MSDVDLALNRSTTTNSFDTSNVGYAASSATDGDSTTRWSAGTNAAGTWITSDLGAIYGITRVKLHWEAARAVDYKIQVSNQGTQGTWTDLVDVGGNTSDINEWNLNTSARFVRVNCTRSRTDSANYSLYSFEVYGSADLARGKATVASSVYQNDPQYAAPKATDGNISTRWMSANQTPAWLYVDLGGTYDVNRVRTTWTEGAYASSYKIQVSDDAANWRDAYSVTSNTTPWNDTSLSARGRYVRVLCLASTVNTRYSLFRLEVYGAPNLAFQRPATASSVYDATGAYVASNATDGNPGTRWASAREAGSQSSIYVNLRESFDINRVRLLWEYSHASSYDIRVSDDAANWTTIYSTRDNNQLVNDVAVSGRGRYVQILCLGSTVNTLYSLWEVEVYGAPNLALGRPSSASSVYEGNQQYAAFSATDGNAGTRWASDRLTPSSLHTDLGAIHDITRVRLRWEYSYASSYQIEVSDNAATWTPVYSTTSNNQLVNDVALSGRGRYVRVVCNGSTVNNLYSIYDFEVYGVAPIAPAPQNVTAVAAQPAPRIVVNWSAVGGARGFRIERVPLGSNTYVAIADVGPDSTSYVDTTVDFGWSYWYRVRSLGDNGWVSEPSMIFGTSTQPAAPPNFSATSVSDTQVDLSWSDVQGESYYIVQRSTDNVNWTEVARPGINLTSFRDSGLAAGALYYYRVMGEGGGGLSDPSTASATTKPLAPAAFNVTLGDPPPRINITWSSAPGASGYRLERKPIGSDTWTTIATPAAGTTSYADTDLLPGNTYYYQIRSTAPAWESAPSPTYGATTAPAAPASLTVSATGMTSISLTWSAVSGASLYRIERSPNGADGWQEVATRPAPTVSLHDPDLEPGTTHYYRVKAANGGGDSDPSPVRSTITVSAPPTGLAANAVATNAIDVSWSPATGAEGYYVDRSPDGVDGWVEIGSSVAAAFRDSTASPGTRYYYAVRSYNSSGASPRGGTVDATTFAAAPEGLAASSISTTAVTLVWQDVVGETGYRVERSTTGTGGWSLVGNTAADVLTLSDSGLSSGSAYFYRVLSINASGESSAPPLAVVTLPDAPQNLRTTGSDGRVDLVWDDVAGETGYKIERRPENPTGAWSEIATTAAGETAFANTGLPQNATYSYRVRAYNQSGDSQYSNVDSATTAHPPAAPVELTAAAVSYFRVNLAWDDNSNNETAFRLERRVLPDGPWTPIATLESGATSYADTAVVAATPYGYRVCATNEMGDSAFAADEVTTPPNNPPSVTTPAAASPQTVTDTTASLSVRASDDGGAANLLYTWSVEQPTGVAAPTFDVNGSNAAQDTTATFYAAGAYRFTVSVTDGINPSVTSFVDVTVEQSVTAIAVTPATAAVHETQVQQFAASATDQFGHAMAPPPAFTWAVESGAGTLDATGLYTAPAAEGSATVTASSGGVIGSATVTVTNQAPSVAATASASPATVTGTETLLAARGADDAGEAALTYTWSAIGSIPAPVAFAPNGTNAAKASTATFTRAGAYTLRCTITDREGLSTITDVTVTVNQTVSSLTLTPATASVSPGATRTFQAAGSDQFGNAISTLPPLEWTVDAGGIGSVDATGTYSAPAGQTGGATVRVTAGGVSATAAVTIASKVPAAPGPVRVTGATASSISVGWDDTSPDETGFELGVSGDGGATWTSVDLAANATSYTAAGLEAGRQYHFRLLAYSPAGRSPLTPEAAAVTVPAAPRILPTTAVSSRRVDLAWEPVRGESGYTIERRDGTTWGAIASVGVGQSTFSVAGLLPATAYEFRVRAYNPGGDSDPSAPVGATTSPAAPPAAPVDFAARASSLTTAEISWRGGSDDEEGFLVQMSQNGGIAWSQLGTAAAGAQTYLATGLVAGASYRFRAYAFNANGDSAFSAEASVEMPTAESAPVAPGALTAASSLRGVVDLKWEDRSGNELGFRVEQSANGGAFTPVAAAPAGAAGAAVAGLTAGTTYAFRVVAYNAAGDSPASNVASAAATAFDVPTDVTAAATENAAEVKLTWRHPNPDELSGYLVEKSTDGITFSDHDTVWSGYSDYTAYDVPAGVRQYFRLRAFVGDARSEPSAVVSAVPAGLAAPADVKVQVQSPTEVKVSFTAPDPDAEVSIEYSPDGGETYVNGGTAPAGASEFVVDGLAPQTKYLFRVTASKSGTSQVSVPQATRTAAPTEAEELSAWVAWHSGISLSWYDYADNETGFKIEYSADGGQWAALPDAPANKNENGSYTSTLLTLPTNKHYDFRVRAFNGAGATEWTNTASLDYFLPGDPSNLRATPNSVWGVFLTWTPSPNNVYDEVLEWSDDGDAWTVFSGGASPHDGGYEVNNLFHDKPKYFRVRGVNAVGYSAGYAETDQPVAGDEPVPGTIYARGRRIGDAQWPYGVEVVEHKADVPPQSVMRIGNESGWGVGHAQEGTVGAGDHGTFIVGGYWSWDLEPRYGRFWVQRMIFGPGPTLPSATTSTVPAVPTNVRVVSSDLTNVTLAWDAARGAESYDVSYLVPVPGQPGEYAPAHATTSGTSITITGLSIGVHWFSVYAVALGGRSIEGGSVGVNTTPGPVDLDIDSNNDGKLDHERDENTDDVRDTTGKIIDINYGDLDGDGVPDFVDGFNRDGVPDNADDRSRQDDSATANVDEAAHFTQLTLQLPDAKFPIGPMRVKLAYDFSHPVDDIRGPATSDSGDWEVARGRLRLWTEDAWKQRVAQNFTARGTGDAGKGFLVMPTNSGVAGDTRPAYYDATALGFTAGQRMLTFYAELVAPGRRLGDVRVVASVDPDGDGPLDYQETAVRITAGAVDLDVDSDNTSAGSPERDPAEESGEDDPTQPGKILVVNDGDRDADGMPDFADGYAGSAGGQNAAIRFVPLAIEGARWVDLSRATFKFEYDASDPDPAKVSGSEGVGFIPAPGDQSSGRGLLRVWRLPSATQTARNPADVAHAGNYVRPGVAFTAAQLGINTTTRSGELYLEAVRPSAQPGDVQVKVLVDPDGDGPLGFVGADNVRLTAVHAAADAERSGAVTLFDGSASHDSTDLANGGFGGAWGHSRHWSNQMPFRLVSDNGNGVSVAEWPRLLQATSSVIAIVGGRATYFDSDGAATPAFTPRFGGLDVLKYDAVKREYVLTDPTGNQVRFNDFRADDPVAFRGSFKSLTDPAGNLTAVTAYDAQGRIKIIERGQVTFEYAYVTEAASENLGRLQSVTMKKAGGATIRKAEFAYYVKADAGGEAGDLKSVTVSNEGSLVLDRRFYRYYNGGGGLKYAFGTSALARMSVAVSDPSSASDAEIAPYADLYLEYDGKGRVAKQVVQGAGSSGDTDVDARGTFDYRYGDSDKMGVAVNASGYQTTETRPGGYVVSTFANHAGQTLMSNAVGGALTTYQYYAGGRLKQAALPTGQTQTFTYYTSGDHQGYLQDVTLSDQAGHSVKLLGLTYSSRVIDGVTTHPVSKEMVNDGSRDLTTEYQYTYPAQDARFAAETRTTILPDGSKATETLDSFGRVVDSVDADGRRWSATYDALTGAVKTQTFYSGSQTIQTAFEVDDLGRTRKVTDPEGFVTDIVYSDLTHKRTVTTRPQGGPEQVEVFDLATGDMEVLRTPPGGGQPTRVSLVTTDYAGRPLTSRRYPQAGDLGQSYVTTSVYDNAGRLYLVVDPSGTVTKTVFDAMDRPAEEYVGASVGSLTLVREFKYDRSGNLTDEIVHPGGDAPDRLTKWTYDWRNRVSTQTPPEGAASTYKWNELGQLESESRGDLKTSYAYDRRGRSTGTVVAGGGQSWATTTSYGAFGSTTTTTPDGLVRTISYDGAGRQVGDLVSAGGMRVSDTATRYDRNGNVTSVATTRYPANGPGKTSTTTSSYSTTAANRLERVTQQGMYVTTYEYDAAGNVNKTRDPRGIPTEYTYDQLGRLRGTIEGPGMGLSRGTIYDYDGLDHVIRSALVLPTGYQETMYDYGWGMGRNDLLGRIRYPSKTGGGASGNATDWEVFQYNNLGEVTEKIDRSQVKHKYEYDKMGRLKSDSVSNLPPTMDARVTSLEYDYDSLGRPTFYRSRGNAAIVSEVHRTYDLFGRVSSETTQGTLIPVYNTDPTGAYQAVVGYTYFGNSLNVRTATYPDGTVITYDYDTAMRPTAVKQGGQTLETTSYLGFDQIVSRAYPQPVASLAVGVDALGRVNDVHWSKGATSLDWFSYGFDRSSNLLYKEVKVPNPANAALPRPSSFSERYAADGVGDDAAYDPLNRMVAYKRGTLAPNKMSVPSPSINKTFNYDAASNRTNDHDYNKQGQITDDGYAYDAAGNTLKIGPDTQFIYDAWNRLTRLESKRVDYTTVESGGEIVVVSTTYTDKIAIGYDALGRQAQIAHHKKVTGASSPNVDVQTRVVLSYSGNQVIQETSAPGTTLGAPSARYVWDAAGSHLILRDRDANGNAGDGLEERLYVLQDAQNNVTALLDVGGSVVRRYAYDLSGNQLMLDANWQPVAGADVYDWAYTYKSGRLLGGSRLIHLNGRDYDPVEERFLEPDPQGYSNARNAYTPRHYLERSVEQLFLGHYYSGEPTAYGTTLQVLAGFTGLDILGDLRDLYYDFSHWEWSWSHFGQTVLDGVGLLPIVGVLKHLDEVAAVSKGVAAARQSAMLGSIESGRKFEAKKFGGRVVDSETLATVQEALEKLYTSRGMKFEGIFTGKADSQFLPKLGQGGKIIGGRIELIGSMDRQPLIRVIDEVSHAIDAADPAFERRMSRLWGLGVGRGEDYMQEFQHYQLFKRAAKRFERGDPIMQLLMQPGDEKLLRTLAKKLRA